MFSKQLRRQPSSPHSLPNYSSPPSYRSSSPPPFYRSQSPSPPPSYRSQSPSRSPRRSSPPRTRFIGPSTDPQKYTLDLDQVLGKGQYGIQYKGIQTKTGDKVAIKFFIDPDRIQREKQYHKEVNCLRKVLQVCKISDIICLVDDFTLPNSQYVVVTPLLEGYMTLYDYLENPKTKLTKKESLDIIQKVEKVSSELDKLGIVHGDLHDQNILIHPISKKLKVIDLGLCMTKEEEKRQNKKHPEYSTENRMKTLKYVVNKKADSS
jgi:hypothetical protein